MTPVTVSSVKPVVAKVKWVLSAFVTTVCSVFNVVKSCPSPTFVHPAIVTASPSEKLCAVVVTTVATSEAIVIEVTFTELNPIY